jgi:hypothetical protein
LSLTRGAFFNTRANVAKQVEFSIEEGFWRVAARLLL